MATIAPKLTARLPARQLEQSASVLLSTLRLARELAKTEQKTTIVFLDVDNKSFGIKTISELEDPNATSTTSVVSQYLAKDIQITQLDGLARIGRLWAIVFWPDGSAQNGQMLLSVGSNETLKYNIIIRNDGWTYLQQVSGREQKT